MITLFVLYCLYLMIKLTIYVCIIFPFWLLKLCLRILFSPFTLLLGIPFLFALDFPSFGARSFGGFSRGAGSGRR